MPTFKYEAAYASGERVSGVIEAVSQNEAVAQIRQTCEVVLSLKEVPKLSTRKAPMERFRKFSAKSLALTCQQFAIILRAGLPLVQTVNLVADQCSDKGLTKLLRQVADDVTDGWSMSRSLEQRAGGRLPVTFQETVRAGEESGDLVASFERLSAYFDRMGKTRDSVVGALTYPLFVIAVAVVVIFIIMGYAVPTFTGMFASMDTELPGVTKALIGMSDFCRNYGLAVLAVIVLLALGLKIFSATEKGGKIVSRAQLNLPILGDVVRMSGASQFAHTMSTLFAAGMPILQAIEVSGRTMNNQCMADEVLDTLPGVEGGRTLGECMGYSKELPPMLVQMTSVGEATGSLESTLGVLAEYYDNEVEVKTKRALGLLEPAIIVVLATFVVFVLMAVYLPMFSMYQGMV